MLHIFLLKKNCAHNLFCSLFVVCIRCRTREKSVLFLAHWICHVFYASLGGERSKEHNGHEHIFMYLQLLSFFVQTAHGHVLFLTIPFTNPSRFHATSLPTFTHSKLGEGAFSTVKVCTHRNAPATPYAVKIVDRSVLTDEDTQALLDEVSILFSLKSNPHIIVLYDFFEGKDYYHLVMETMKGGELFDRIVKKSFYNEKEARGVCRILLEAIAYCHDARVVS